MYLTTYRRPAVGTWMDNVLDVGREIDNIFDNLVTGDRQVRQYKYPTYDLVEYENESILIAEIPGVKKDEIHLSVNNGELVISGERKPYETPENASWIRNEIRSGRYQRAIELPHDVDTNRITAELQNGILRVVLPKAESIKPREIKIK